MTHKSNREDSIMENKNNTPVSEENLENVAGGLFGVHGCWFKPTGKVRTVDSKTEAECAARCFELAFCVCHGKDHCVDKWHAIDARHHLLIPFDFSNHEAKGYYWDLLT